MSIFSESVVEFKSPVSVPLPSVDRGAAELELRYDSVL